MINLIAHYTTSNNAFQVWNGCCIHAHTTTGQSILAGVAQILSLLCHLLLVDMEEKHSYSGNMFNHWEEHKQQNLL